MAVHHPDECQGAYGDVDRVEHLKILIEAEDNLNQHHQLNQDGNKQEEDSVVDKKSLHSACLETLLPGDTFSS